MKVISRRISIALLALISVLSFTSCSAASSDVQAAVESHGGGDKVLGRSERTASGGMTEI